jgi:DNA-binding MarR family transcriptional regulator
MSNRPVLPPGVTLPPMDRGSPPEVPRSTSRQSGRFQEINDFVDVTIRTLTRSEIAAWLILWRDSRDGIARTSLAGIADRGGYSERQAVRVIKQLEKAGLLVVVSRGGLGRGPSVYRVTPVSPSPVTPRVKTR